MKREIKFRGKRVDSGEWVYGYYVKSPDDHHCIVVYSDGKYERYPIFNEVIPETIDQFTGCYAKGVEVFEGDIIKTNEAGWIGYVVFDYGSFYLTDKEGGFCGNTYVWKEVIGNIHDNPELLESLNACD